MDLYSRLTSPKRETLVDGYVREHSIEYFPNELSKLCFLFYNAMIDWKMEGNTLTQLLQSQSGDYIHGPKFTVNRIPFQLVIFPNGYYKHKGYVLLTLVCKTKTLPSHIQQFLVYIEFVCFETKYIFKRCAKFDTKKDHCIRWYRYGVSLDKLKKANYKTLNFGCYVEILNVKYKTKNHMLRLSKPICMNNQYEYQWILNKNELDIFKSSEVDSSLYSQNFNNQCWCILFIPFGWSYLEETQNYLFAKIKLLQFPWNIKRIDVDTRFVVNCNTHSVEWNHSIKCNVDGPGNVDINNRIETAKLLNTDYLSITVTMKIVKAFDECDIEIDKDEWVKYGIVDFNM